MATWGLNPLFFSLIFLFLGLLSTLVGKFRRFGLFCLQGFLLRDSRPIAQSRADFEQLEQVR